MVCSMKEKENSHPGVTSTSSWCDQVEESLQSLKQGHILALARERQETQKSFVIEARKRETELWMNDSLLRQQIPWQSCQPLPSLPQSLQPCRRIALGDRHTCHPVHPVEVSLDQGRERFNAR